MIWNIVCLFVGAFIGAMAIALVSINREKPPMRRFDGNKVVILGTNAQGVIVTERHFDTKTAMSEALLAAEFLVLNEGVREDGVTFTRRRLGTLMVESTR